MLVTICTIRQLPQAFALGDSFVHYTAQANGQFLPVLIGLIDDPAQLPADFICPYPLLAVGDLLPAEQLADLSAAYTPTELAAACKPLLLAEIFRRYTEVDKLIYADPNIYFFSSLTPVWEQLSTANVLLTPFITKSPADTYWPDEKFFQNVGLYCADFLAFQRSAETSRFLAWWDDRVRKRAYVDFCAGLCTDQLWLMHVPVFFRKITVVKNPGWHAALWNLLERTIDQRGSIPSVTGPAGQHQPLVFANFKGLLKRDEGFFPHQNRLNLSRRPDAMALLTAYQQAVSVHSKPFLTTIRPAYGLQPEPPVLRGWKRSTVTFLKAMTRFLDQVPLPVIR